MFKIGTKAGVMRGMKKKGGDKSGHEKLGKKWSKSIKEKYIKIKI